MVLQFLGSARVLAPRFEYLAPRIVVVCPNEGLLTLLTKPPYMPGNWGTYVPAY